MGQKIADKATREGVAERFPDPAVQKSIAVDLERIGHYAPRLRDMELAILNTAKPHDANTRSLLRTVPGIGEMLSLVRLYAIHAIHRFPRVQDVLPSGRLVKCAKEAAGERFATSGAKIGNAYLTWAFSAAAGLFRRDHPVAQQYLARLAKQQGKGKAFTVLAHQLARAVYDRRTRAVACETQQFFPA